MYCASPSSPTNTCVRVRYSFFTDVVTLYVLLICRNNDKLRLGSLLSLHLESVVFAICLGVMLSNLSKGELDVSGIAVLVAFLVGLL